VMMKGDVNPQGSNSFVGVTFNGITGGYEIRANDDTATVGLPSGRLTPDKIPSGQTVSGELLLKGTGNFNVSARNIMSRRRDISMTQVISSQNGFTPLTSVGMKGESTTIDVKMRVYGFTF